MASQLIEHMKIKSQDHEQLRLLVSQWEFDEKLIPKALQNIGQLFPHYTRHDASHSLQILVNIERLLGENINKLTVTDTWLILEAAYWHDIGMVVPADKIASDFETDEFKYFLSEIMENKGHELQDFAKKFNHRSASSCFSGIESPFDAAEKFRLLLAEYYRSQHSKRSESIVVDPWTEASISSPRTELLPKRLFSMLGRICHLHGKDFSCISKELEFRQVGMGTEDCHPRFVACLLRLGDLLDLDSNRFCPVMQRMIGSMPKSSQSHIDKHNAIQELRLDRERIEVTAICGNAAAYEETERWFSMLRLEMQQQMACWRDIVPARSFGLLPTLGKLQVNLEGDEQLLDSGSRERPRFDIDAEKTIELLQGAGLYENPEQSLRELLQNAVDATLQRIWLDFFSGSEGTPFYENLKISPTDWDNPYNEKIEKLLKNFTIEIKFEPALEDSENNKNIWRFSIRDYGIGISRDDLKRLRYVGSSNRNYEKKERIRKMPSWMRPSGAFGIGLQSAFMLSETINFQTRSYLTGESQIITMYSPSGSQQGLITVKKYDSSLRIPYGSLLTLSCEFDKVPRNFSYSSYDDSKSKQALYSFDPVAHQELHIEPSKWLDEIEKFSRESLVPIRCHFNEKVYEFSRDIEDQNIYFDSDTNIGLEVYPIVGNRREILYFRGQIIGKYQYSNLPFLAATYHLWGEDAAESLTINRNDINSKSVTKLQNKLMKALTNYLKKSIPAEEGDKAYWSAFIKIQNFNLNDFPNLRDEWKDLTLQRSHTEKKCLGDLLNLSEFNIIRVRPDLTNLQNPVKYKNDSLYTEEFFENSYDNSCLKLLAHEWQKLGFYFHISEKNEKYTKFTFQRELHSSGIPYTDKALKGILLEQARLCAPYTRILVPIYSDYQRLSLKKTTDFYLISGIEDFDYFSCKLMLFPFYFSRPSRSAAKVKITEKGLDDLCKWTVINAEDDTLTVTEALNLYKKYIHWIDAYIMKDDEAWIKLRNISSVNSGYFSPASLENEVES